MIGLRHSQGGARTGVDQPAHAGLQGRLNDRAGALDGHSILFASLMAVHLGGDVEEVFSFSTRSANSTFAPYEFPSTTVAMLRFKDGRLGKVASVLDCFQPYYFHTHLVGSEGTLLDDKFHSNLVAGHDRKQWNKLPYQPVDSGDVSDHPYREQFNCFFEALARGEEMPMTGLRDAVRTHEVIFAADRSWQEKRPVKLAEIAPL